MGKEIENDERIKCVATNMGYSLLKRRIADYCEEAKAAYEQAYTSGTKLSVAEKYLVRVLARLYVYILAFRSLLDEEQKKHWDDVVEYELKLHKDCFKERQG